jgi:hypothetical protein
MMHTATTSPPESFSITNGFLTIFEVTNPQQHHNPLGC